MKILAVALTLFVCDQGYAYQNYNKVMNLIPSSSSVSPLDIEVNGPSAIAVSGSLAYIANLVSQSILVVDTTNNTLVRAYTHPSLTAPYNLVVSQDGRYVYVANFGRPLTILDTQTGAFSTTSFYANFLAIDSSTKNLFLIINSIPTKSQESRLPGFFDSQALRGIRSKDSTRDVMLLYVLNLDNPVNPKLIKSINVDVIDWSSSTGIALTYDTSNVYVGYHSGLYFPGQILVSVNRNSYKRSFISVPTNISGNNGASPGNQGMVVIGDTLYHSFGYQVDLTTKVALNFNEGTYPYFVDPNNANAILYDGNKYLYIANTRMGSYKKTNILCSGGYFAEVTPGYAGTQLFKYDVTQGPVPVFVEEIVGFNSPIAMAVLPNGYIYVIDMQGKLSCSHSASGALKKISSVSMPDKGKYSIKR
jgi:hypothetical protein